MRIVEEVNHLPPIKEAQIRALVLRRLIPPTPVRPEAKSLSCFLRYIPTVAIIRQVGNTEAQVFSAPFNLAWSGNYNRRVGQYTGPASYATGGDTLPPEQLGLGNLDALLFTVATNGTVVILLAYNYTTEMVKAFDMAGAEIANGTDLSAYTARFEAIGL